MLGRISLPNYERVGSPTPLVPAAHWPRSTGAVETDQERRLSQEAVKQVFSDYINVRSRTC